MVEYSASKVHITLLFLLLALIVGIGFSVYIDIGENKNTAETLDGFYAFNFDTGECRYFERGDSLPHDYEIIDTYDKRPGEICKDYERLYELRISFETKINESGEDLKLLDKGISAVEARDLEEAEKANAKIEGRVSTMTYYLTIYSNILLAPILLISGVVTLRHLLEKILIYKIEKLTEKVTRSAKQEGSKEAKKSLKKILEADEKTLNGNYIKAYLKYREANKNII